MPLPISGSADITVLDFSVLFDISGAIPSITLTNLSVGNPSGTTNLNLCTWWYVITSPIGTYIHQGSVTAPDVVTSNWTTLTIPANSWPTPFGTPPCGHVEFGCSTPYVCTLFVKDASGTIYSYAKSRTICAPNGNTNNTCGSFGGANVMVEVQCQNAEIYASDTTNYTYQGLLGESQSSLWTLRYPADASGIPPANATAVNAPYVFFPVGYSGEGYTLYLQTYALYNFGDGTSVKIQYKLISGGGVGSGKTFGVWCNIDLCKLDCELQKFYELVKTSCGQVENPELKQKALQINLLYNRVLTGIIQPLCNIDVPKIIHEIEKLGGFTCDCCCGAGINVGNPVPSPGGSSGCCPTKSPVYVVGTTNAPSQCPNSYFPIQVYDPTGTIIIGTASSADDLVAMLNNNAAWAAYGTAFNEGNCQVGWYALNSGTVIPPVYVAEPAAPPITTCTGNTQNYTVTISDVCNSTTAVTASAFPFNVYINYGLGAGLEFVGNVASQTALVAALNAMSDKPSTITFSAGSAINVINVFNSSCTVYSGVITIVGDYGSSSFMLYGGNHTSVFGTTPTLNGEYGLGVKTATVLGEIAGSDPTKHTWHTIKISNFVITSEGDTGLIRFYDVTNPLMPVLARTIQLNDTGSGTCFTGVPNAIQIVGGASVPSFYSLYFPTDTYGSMSLNAIYVCEGITGSIWELDFYSSGTGVVASFADVRLLGKCPRVYYAAAGRKPILFFSQDGNLENAAGLASTVTAGSIVKLDTSAFSSSGLSVQSLGLQRFVLAASFDGANTIWFTDQGTNIITYNVTTQTVINTYPSVLSSTIPYDNTVNTIIFANTLYIASLHNYGFNPLVGVSVSPGPLIAILDFDTTEVDNFFNLLPLGNCLAIATGFDPVTNRGRTIIYNIFTGAALGEIGTSSSPSIPLRSINNFVAIPNVATYTPNSLV